ncbi:MAG: galactonate dehydratase [Planctomycetota bacterium]|nr:galactonate dehydratase [Planctomycetota bacterium]MDA1137004.1 galactonate dehydratase [Planctomycetota bacterium]
MKITRLETFLVKPRWLFLKIHTDEGIVGLGEPYVEGRARTCAEAVKEYEHLLIGKDPRRVQHLWQSMYRHTFYRGGPVLTSVISGIEQALWDILGKSLGVPVYQLLGGACRDRIRLYKHAGGGDPESAARSAKDAVKAGFTALKTGVAKKGSIYTLDSPATVEYAVEVFAAMRRAVGSEVDIGIDFHGAISPAMAKQLIKGYEPYSPFFIEEPVQCQNVDVLAEIARSTHLPIATGERVYTKWGFREILEKQAATVLQPDLSHAGGIMECRFIAAMAETYYGTIAPHCPLGPIALAACLQLAACTPNHLAQENVTLGEGYLKEPFIVKDGYVDLPQGPGLGIELDEEALADKIGHEWTNPETYHKDGSVADW